MLDPVLPRLIQVAHAADQTVVEKGSNLGSGLWMFIIMTIVFILVLKFGRKKPLSKQLESAEFTVEKNIKNNGTATTSQDNCRNAGRNN